MGAAGIDLNHSTLHSVVRDNTVRNIAGNGIMVGSFVVDENTDVHTVYHPEDETQICTGDKIVNNLATEIGTDYEGSEGIAAGYTVKNNVINDASDVWRNQNGEDDYQENKNYVNKKADPRTWFIIANAGKKKCYTFFEKLHY